MRHWSRFILPPYSWSRGWRIKLPRVHGVYLGTRQIGMRYDLSLRPEAGDCVGVGAGATVFGGLSLGDNAKMGGYSALLLSVCPNATITGVHMENPLFRIELPEVSKA
jgi:hypothetical protein